MRQVKWPHMAIIAGILTYCAVAIGSGLDRLSGRKPALAQFVATPLAAQAHRTKAAEALRANRLADAIVAAKAAVLADPIDHRSVALLGAAYLASGQHDEADRSFRIAARFGWRDPLTQLYLMDQARRSGDVGLAVLRLDAVLRQDPRFPLRDMLLSSFEATPHGRAALAERLALRPAWLRQFLAADSPLPLVSLRNRAEVAKAAADRAWGCDTVAPLVNRLVATAQMASAKEVWIRHCWRASTDIADPGFTLQPGQKVTPFDWNLTSQGDVAATPANPPQTGLVARVSGGASRMVAWQLLTLPPGRYRLGWTVVSSPEALAGTVSLYLTCKLGERAPLNPQKMDGSGEFVAYFKLDGSCTGQFLTIWIAPMAYDVRIKSVTLDPTP